MIRRVILTRKQIEQLAILFSLNKNIESVIIEETSPSGIGPSTLAKLNTNNSSNNYQLDITDSESW